MMDFTVTKEIKIQDDIFDARFHPTKENLIAVATIGGNVHLIDGGDITSTLRKHHKGSPIRRLRFDKNGNLVSAARTIKIHDIQSNATIHTLKRNDDSKTIFNATLPLGPSIICAGDDEGKVFVWDTRTSEEVPTFSSSDCDQYISDIDGKYEGRRMFVCTSGEGTLTAYDLRANKMIEPQSELFEAGFQCVKMVESNKKVVIGGEDGAVYVFNQNEWGHTSGKFAVSDDARNRGKCSIEAIDMLPDSSIYLVACSDGRIRSLTLWPHQLLSEKVVCKRRSLECLQTCPIEGSSQVVVAGENYINILKFEEKQEDDEVDPDKVEDPMSAASSADPDESSREASVTAEAQEQHPHGETESEGGNPKKLKVNVDDYLNVFGK